MTRKIVFKRHYKPIGFGDSPDPDTVEGRLRSASLAQDARRFNCIRKDYEEFNRTDQGGLHELWKY